MNPSPLGADRRAEYDGAQTFSAFLASATANQTLWAALSQRASIPEDIARRARSIPGTWHLLVLLEDWCGDGVNTIPVLVRLVEQNPNLSMRLLKRDEHLTVTDEHLTGGKRSIPIVMLLDEDFREVAWWGPRPRELQEWAISQGLKLDRPDRYREMRRWYAVDRGRATAEEVLRLLCEAAGAPSACPAL